MSILLRLVVAWLALALRVALDDVRIAQDARPHVLVARADRPATIALLDAPGEHVTIDGPAVPRWRHWLAAFALGLRRSADAGRYLLLLLLLALPAIRTRH